MEEAYGFYQAQLARFPQAQRYLARRGIHGSEVIARLAHGLRTEACLRAHSQDLGYTRAEMQQSGLVNDQGHDRFMALCDGPVAGSR